MEKNWEGNLFIQNIYDYGRLDIGSYTLEVSGIGAIQANFYCFQYFIYKCVV